jgi:2-hydroxychromene-2-carboxylate isomerase
VLANELGLDGESLARVADSPEAAETLERYTAEAVAAGVFGSPTYVIDGERFWGQDRLDFVAAKLKALS